MAYTTQELIENAITVETVIELTDDKNRKVVNPVHLDFAIKRGDSDIDGKCKHRYILPFSDPVADLVENLSTCLAVYYLYNRRAGEVPVNIQERYDKCMEKLDEIQYGALTIEGAELKKDGKINFSGESRLFTRTSMRHF